MVLLALVSAIGHATRSAGATVGRTTGAGTQTSVGHAHEALRALASELSEAVSVAPEGDSAVVTTVPVGLVVTCVDPGDSTAWRVRAPMPGDDAAWTQGALRAGDSIAVWRGGSWRGGVLLAVAADHRSCDAHGRGASVWRVAAPSPPREAPVVVLRRRRWRAYRDAERRWQFGVHDWTPAGWSNVQPAFGAFDTLAVHVRPAGGVLEVTVRWGPGTGDRVVQHVAPYNALVP
jgi:hypothetical protein